MENLFLQSNSTTTLLVTVVILLVLYVFFPNFDQKTKELPGPRPLPLFGNLLQLDLKSFHSTLFELSKKYGSVFTVYLGHRKVVVLAGYKTVKEALVNHAVEFGERHVTPSSHDLNGSCRNGIIFGNGESWEEMRRFALSNLRDFGMGKKAGEDKIIEEIQYLIKEFEGHEGQPFSAAKSINYAVSNIISSIVYGSRFEYGDEEFKLMVDRANENIQLVGSPSIQLFNMYPWIFQWASNRMRLKRNVAENRKQVKRLIGRLQETLNVHMRRGFVDSFLAHKQRLEDLKISDSHYNFENLVSTTGNLFAAGTDTTGTTLRWVLLLMAKYPRIQDQVQVELSRVVGDRQGTAVFPLLTSVLWDESEWESPRTFNPAHFLDKDGKFVKRDAFMPFSTGRRACPGEGLARMELFLFFTSLLQRFRFTPPPGVREDDLDLTPAVGFTRSPTPHELCAVSREGIQNSLISK
ncbi:cytochrome P450 2K1-like isoform 2-T2 [Spinachia spinachia]